MKRVVILDDYQNVAGSITDWSPLDGRVERVIVNHHIDDRPALIETLKGAAIVMAMRERTPFDADLLANLPDLKLLVTTGMANRSIDMEAAAANDIMVCGARGGNGHAAAEMSWALLMAVARHVPQENARFHKGDPVWQHILGQELAGRTLGLIGFGGIGKRMARYAAAFDMKVLAWSRSLTDDVAAENGAQRADSVMTVMQGSDYVSVHLAQTPETIGMIGVDEIAAMKASASLINTARGPIVDEAALIDALQQGRIAGAGLDVFDIEPLPLNHPLRRLANVVATPHTGYVTIETYRAFFADTVKVIEGFLSGSPIHVLND